MAPLMLILNLTLSLTYLAFAPLLLERKAKKIKVSLDAEKGETKVKVYTSYNAGGERS